MTLEILVCTIDNGIENIPKLLLPPIDRVSYLISWQHSTAVTTAVSQPQCLNRNDVKIIHLTGKGLSRNRNNAIRHATGDICLIADDDCTYKPEYFNRIIETFSNDSSLDLATFRMKYSSIGKNYPQHSFNLKFPESGYYVTSFEIAFRRTSIQNQLWFNELFGLGAPVLQSGEENLFVLDAIQKGLSCKYFPLVIVEHDHETTSTSRASNSGVIMAEGAYIFIAYPYSYIPRLILKAIRLNKINKLGFFRNLTHLIKGITYYQKHK